jgi:hypothetical protein
MDAANDLLKRKRGAFYTAVLSYIQELEAWGRYRPGVNTTHHRLRNLYNTYGESRVVSFIDNYVR